MIPKGKTILITLCLVGVLFAQVEEVPQLRSTQEREPAADEKSASEVLETEVDSSIPERDHLPGEKTEQIRSFVTINAMIILILVLIVALVFFLIVRKTRRSKKQ